MRLVLAGVLSLAVLSLFIGLGIWQLQRLEWKRGVIADIEARIQAAPVPVPAHPDPEADRYLPVTARGTLGEGVRVLASHRDLGPGYRIVRALTLPDGRRVLVDLGFQTLDEKSALGPPLEVTLTGNLHWPDDQNRWTPPPEPEQRLWFARDLPALAKFLGTEPLLIVARSVSPQIVTPMPVTTEGIPNRHLEYVFTWFGLAATWAVMTAFALWRIRRRNP